MRTTLLILVLVVASGVAFAAEPTLATKLGGALSKLLTPETTPPPSGATTLRTEAQDDATRAIRKAMRERLQRDMQEAGHAAR